MLCVHLERDRERERETSTAKEDGDWSEERPFGDLYIYICVCFCACGVIDATCNCKCMHFFFNIVYCSMLDGYCYILSSTFVVALNGRRYVRYTCVMHIYRDRQTSIHHNIYRLAGWLACVDYFHK